MKIELTRQEVEALMSLLSQVQIRAVSPDAVQAATLYQNLGNKFVGALTAENEPLAVKPAVQGTNSK